MKEGLFKHGEQVTVVIPQDNAKQRIDQFLNDQFPMYSRSFFHRAIEDGYISLDGKLVTKSGQQVRPGQTVQVTFPHKRKVTQEMVQEAQPDVAIIAQEPHFFIINKPAGLLVHPTTATHNVVTLMDWLLHTLEAIDKVGYIDRPGIIHRLDKDTSGLMIIPRTNYAYNVFGQLFKDREIEKVYCAVVKGHPPKEGTIDLAIARHPEIRNRMMTLEPKKRELQTSTKVRHARTHYTVEKYFEDAALLRVQLETGRTHQIRVHLASIGHPIIGDPLYGTPSKLIKRQALHAQKLAFTFDDKRYSYTSELPAYIRSLLKQLKPTTTVEHM